MNTKTNEGLISHKECSRKLYVWVPQAELHTSTPISGNSTRLNTFESVTFECFIVVLINRRFLCPNLRDKLIRAGQLYSRSDTRENLPQRGVYELCSLPEHCITVRAISVFHICLSFVSRRLLHNSKLEA
jgi:hypothetical protein